MLHVTGRLLGLLWAVRALPGCGEPVHDTDVSLSDPGPYTLIDHEAWRVADPAEDPFATHRPTDINCPEWAYGLEDEVFEVETNDCNYLALTQPSVAPIRAGDRVRATIWHLQLWSVEPATAHVAVTIGSDVLWERDIQVPGPVAMHKPELVVSDDRPAGTPIHFHLHNHGENSWRFLSLERLPP